MVKNLILGVLVVGLLLFITACSQSEIKATPVTDATTELAEKQINPCEGVVCKEDEQCVDGNCFCKNGYKSCNNVCIPQADCCGDKDCGEGTICEDKKCIAPLCDYNQYFSSEEGKCVCEEETKYCDEQKKCIPKNSCCELLSCGREFRCARTTFSPDICLSNDKKICKVVHEKREDVFLIEDTSFKIKVEDLLQRGSLNLSINDKLVELSGEEVKEISPGIKLYVEGITTFGGICKEEPD